MTKNSQRNSVASSSALLRKELSWIVSENCFTFHPRLLASKIPVIKRRWIEFIVPT